MRCRDGVLALVLVLPLLMERVPEPALVADEEGEEAAAPAADTSADEEGRAHCTEDAADDADAGEEALTW